MPTELRKIVFTADEVLTAVYDHCLRNSRGMPNAAVKSLEVVKSHELMVILHFDTDGIQADDRFEVGSSDVAAAMIRYCSRIGVPLPRAARKALQPEGAGLAMLINLNYTTPATARQPKPSAAA